MKKNGFTFIEILGVITLLALMSIIVLMVVDKSLKDSKSTLSDVQIENIKSAASMWRTDNIEYIPTSGYYTITLGQLIDSGYIADIVDPKSGNSFNRNLVVKVDMNNIIVDEQSSINDITDANITSEVALINSNVDSGILDGVYYYNGVGNLERDASIIYLSRSWNNPKGSILVHNHRFVSGCITIGSNSYDYYNGVVTKLNYSCSTNRGDNLIVNGDLSFKNNTNFSQFTYNKDGYVSYSGSTATNNYNKSFRSDNYIPVDLSKKYNIGVTAKTNNTSTKVYMGFLSYDVDHNLISSNNVMYVDNTLTTLARDLNNGDQYIYLTDMTNWYVSEGGTDGTKRGIILWNYVDSFGYHYPEFTYSQNAWNYLYIDDNIQVGVAVDENDEIIEGQSGNVNRIKLNSAWNHGNFSAGTKLSQSSAGGAYNYNLKANSYFNTQFTNYDGLIYRTSVNESTADKFRYGTRYIKWFVWPNYNGLENVTTDYKDFYLREVVE